MPPDLVAGEPLREDVAVGDLEVALLDRRGEADVELESLAEQLAQRGEVDRHRVHVGRHRPSERVASVNSSQSMLGLPAQLRSHRSNHAGSGPNQGHERDRRQDGRFGGRGVGSAHRRRASRVAAACLMTVVRSVTT